MLIGPPSGVTSRVRRRRLFSVICVTFYSSTVTIRMFRGILQPIKLGDALRYGAQTSPPGGSLRTPRHADLADAHHPLPSQGGRLRLDCGLSDHVSIFVDARDRVKRERLWTFRAGGFAADFAAAGLAVHWRRSRHFAIMSAHA